MTTKSPVSSLYASFRAAVRCRFALPALEFVHSQLLLANLRPRPCLGPYPDAPAQLLLRHTIDFLLVRRIPHRAAVLGQCLTNQEWNLLPELRAARANLVLLDFLELPTEIVGHEDRGRDHDE